MLAGPVAPATYLCARSSVFSLLTMIRSLPSPPLTETCPLIASVLPAEFSGLSAMTSSPAPPLMSVSVALTVPQTLITSLNGPPSISIFGAVSVPATVMVETPWSIVSGAGLPAVSALVPPLRTMARPACNSAPFGAPAVGPCTVRLSPAISVMLLTAWMDSGFPFRSSALTTRSSPPPALSSTATARNESPVIVLFLMVIGL
jgi:hypothetical protein